jgi:hypothetical protein
MARVAFTSRSSTGKLPAGSLGASVLLIQFHFDLFPRNPALGIAPMLLEPPVEFVGLCGSERRFMAFAGDTSHRASANSLRSGSGRAFAASNKSAFMAMKSIAERASSFKLGT